MNSLRIKTSACLLFSLISCCGLGAQQQSPGNAETIHETGQQYKQGNTLMGAGDNRLIGRQAASDANLMGRKRLVDLKPNTFLALWNNPLFAAQFEKFLSAPAETSDDARLYRERINKIMELLSPGSATKQNQDVAFNLLTKASEFESDANICTTIHDAVYAAADSRVEIEKLTQLNEKLETERRQEEYNLLQASRDNPFSATATSKNDIVNNNANMAIERQARIDPAKRRLSAVGQTIEQNKMQIASAEGQAKFQLQALILQLFAQRRYQHVIIADRFYRALFDDGDESLASFQRMADQMGYNKAAGQVKLVAEGNPNVAGAVGSGGGPGAGAAAGAGTNGGGASVGNNNYGGGGDGSALSLSGMQFGLQNASVESLMNAVSSAMRTMSRTFKSLSQLDGIANEIIRDVNEGVKVYKYLLEKNELESAGTQLASVFTKGEFLPSVRLLTQDEKRRTLAYAQLCNKLVNSSESGNIDAVQAVVAEIKKQNPSFDDTEIAANIQGIKTASGLHVAQARVAASKGDMQTLQLEITRAASIWPNNPEVQNFSTDMAKLSERASPQVQAVNDFDQLCAQKNFRQIWDDKEKYIAAIAQSPEKQGKLHEVLSRMQDIETTIMKSQEIARHGDYAGAWEGIEVAFQKYPDDPKLAQMRAELTTQAPDFVHDLRAANGFEEKKEYGSALAWYLRSRSRYPMSDLSKEGIQRVVKMILPDAT